MKESMRSQAISLGTILIAVACCSCVGSAAASHCAQLANKYKSEPNRFCIFGKCRRVVIMSTSRAPSVAAAALLAAALRHRLGFGGVSTRLADRSLCQLATLLPKLEMKNGTEYDEMMIHMDADWDGFQYDCPAVRDACANKLQQCSIAGHRLEVVGTATSVNVRLFRSLSATAANDPACTQSNTWPFYEDRPALQKCQFLVGSEEKACIPVVHFSDTSTASQYKDFLKQLNQTQNLRNKERIPYCYVIIKDHAELTERRNDNSSFLFVDYDLWDDESRVELNPLEWRPADVQSVRVGDSFVFRQYATSIRAVLAQLAPRPQDIRQILEINATTHNIDEAACHWADSSAKFENWTRVNKTEYLIDVFVCQQDVELYRKVIQFAVDNIIESFSERFTIDLGFKINNCSDRNKVSNEIWRVSQLAEWQWYAGFLACGEAGAAALQLARHPALRTQLALYDVPAARAPLQRAAFTATGRLPPLAAAVRAVFLRHGWRRVAVISDASSLAEDLNVELFGDGVVKHRNAILSSATDTGSIAAVLRSFRDANSRVFFINACPRIANRVICEAIRLGMAATDEFAWIVREWYPRTPCDGLEEVRVLTVSYWWRGGDDSAIATEGGDGTLRRALTSALGDFAPWPPLAAPMIDAMLLLLQRLTTIRKFPEYVNDLHSNGADERVARELENCSLPGLTQPLRIHKHALSDPLIYVTSWYSNDSTLLSMWRVGPNDNVTPVKVFREAYEGTKPPFDGTSLCLFRAAGDEFTPVCQDLVFGLGAAALALTGGALCVARRMRLQRLKRREDELLIQLLARCERTAAALASHLVDRSALELREELGSGHFGNVHLGILRLPNCAPKSVAVKALRKDAAPAEEAEFLREGCALASLHHRNVVALVGVCAALGPPLLLMENAFFGDLLRYLRARRHLAEMHEQDPYMHTGAESADPEALHVSPQELTRLAREAAAALAHLASKRYLHRDVRAANCLVDARRTLKLADFGLARNLSCKQEGKAQDDEESDYKYVCQRRGVFPVPWMPPESLRNGEFSYASDVWALGVLILEIATLGARPFGDWPPVRILLYVRTGGRPPMPRDASFHTCEVTDMCWHLSVRRRASAQQIESYLRAHTAAVRAALRGCPAAAAPDSTDSGFSDRPQPLYHCPLATDLRVSTL